MNTIFLDIDGVLNSHRSVIAKIKPLAGYSSYMERHHTDIDPVAVGLLRVLTKSAKAEIVISSSWRILHPEIQFYKDLFSEFKWFGAPVVGFTPRVDSGFRGQEVQQYIDTNDFFTGPYIIFDDDSDFFEHQPLIHVDGRNGLSCENYVEACKRFGCEV